MSFVLGVVCIDPATHPGEDFAPLIVQEAVQDAEAWKRACYLDGLSKYFAAPIYGRCYYVFVDSGGPFPSSAVFFPWPDDDPEDSKPIVLKIAVEYRPAIDALLSQLLTASTTGTIVVVCEWNGDVTRVKSSEEAQADLASGKVPLYGPFALARFWQAHDLGSIQNPSITVVHEPVAPR